MVSNLIKGIICGVIANIITFFQLQGSLKIPILKQNQNFVILLGIPISYLFMISVKYMVAAYDGQLWPSRLIGFGVGVIIFTTLSTLLFKEPITLKTAACLLLGLAIILLQLFWK